MATREQIINENKKYCFKNNLYSENGAPKLQEKNIRHLEMSQAHFEKRFYPELKKIIDTITANPSATEFPGIPSDVVAAAKAFMDSGFGQGRAGRDSGQSANDGADQGAKSQDTKAGADQGTQDQGTKGTGGSEKKCWFNYALGKEECEGETSSGTKNRGNAKSKQHQDQPGFSNATDELYSTIYKHIAHVVKSSKEGSRIKSDSQLKVEKRACSGKSDKAKKECFMDATSDRFMKKHAIEALEKLSDAINPKGTALTLMQALDKLHAPNTQSELVAGHCNFASSSNGTECSIGAKTEKSAVSQFINILDSYCGRGVQCAGDLEHININ
jgi:hypothetical protein